MNEHQLELKAQFPFFTHGNGHVHYLDNGATSQMPTAVLDAITHSYEQYIAPVKRGLYAQASQADRQLHQARVNIQHWINATKPEEIIFTASATTSINMVAQGFLREKLTAEDVVWVTRLEHHANYLPWQQVCHQTGAQLKIIELNSSGEVNWQTTSGLFDENTKFIALSHISNVTGTHLPITEICNEAHKRQIPTLVDGSQAVSSQLIDVQNINCDFYVCSAHKMYGPQGIGLLYGKLSQLECMSPTNLGGGMVDFVADHFRDNQWSAIPARFEAGSANLIGVIGFAKAVGFIQSIGQHNIQQHLKTLTHHCFNQLSQIDGIKIVSAPPSSCNGIISFYHVDVHSHDIAQVCADNHVAVRAGHHCAQPLLSFLDVSGTLRASFAVYNNTADVDALITSVKQAIDIYHL